MASNSQLTATSNPSAGSQSTTNSPQPTVAANSVSGGTPSSIQPGTATSVLTSAGGIPLTAKALSTVNLSATSTQATTAAQPSQHKTNSGLLAFPFILVVVAAVSFWLTTRSAKNTTKY